MTVPSLLKVDRPPQREWLEVALSHVNDAVIATDSHGRVTYVNRAAARLVGRQSADTVGEPFEDVFRFIDPGTREPRANPLETLGSGGDIDAAGPMALLGLAGAAIDVEARAVPVRDRRGAAAGTVVVLRDITERKLTEAAQAEENRILELLSATGRSISAELDLQILVQTITDAATELSGAKFGAFFYNVTNGSGESFLLYTLSGAPREAFQDFGLPRNTPIFEPTFRGEGIVRSANIMSDARYGKVAPHHGMPAGHLPVRSYLAVPVISRSSEVIGGLFFGHPDVGVFTERSERLVAGIAAQAAIAIDNARLYDEAKRELGSRMRTESALQEADRRKDEFLATLAHELRNPLAPIRQAAHIANAPGATDAQKRWSHGVISRQVQHMALLLDDLLDISRVTRGTLELRVEMTELSAVVDAAVETARPAIDAKRHSLTVDMPAEPIQLAADPLRLAQVISNLLTNAAKYTDREGKVSVRARVDGGKVAISVSDNGIGIAREELGGLFDMYSQAKSGRDRAEGGLGIGLALAKGLVALHGGTIEARSAGPERGSEFIISLPLKTLPLKRDRVGDVTEIGTVRRRVLIADDNRDSAESLAMLLRMDGHDVIVVNDGDEALTALRSHPPEVALIDIGMPRLDGYEVARQVRSGPHGQSVTLIAVTGWGQDSDKARALAAGFDHHFTKPIEPERLASLLRSEALVER
jgi:PAS domain S-box-containing protein